MEMLFTFTTAFFALLVGSNTAYAQEVPSCPPLYGGGLICREAQNFRIDKKVQHPGNGTFVDTIPQNELTVDPERTMIFQIDVTNKTDNEIRNITVTDTLPGLTNFVRADREVTEEDGAITYRIDTLEANETDTIKVEVTVDTATALPQSDRPLCVANVVEAKEGNSQALDYVTFCVSSQSEGGQTASQPSFPGQSGQVNGSQTPITLGQVSNATKGGMQPGDTVVVDGKTCVIADNQPTQTKGGQTVYSSLATDKSPNTGPEALGLLALIPATLAGLYLRRKAK